MSTNNSVTPAKTPKQPSHRASITGGVLSVLGLLSAGIGYGLVHANLKTGPAPDAASKVAADVATGTVEGMAKLISMPFLVVGFVLAGLAIVFTVFRMTKVRAGGLAFSLIWLIIGAWTIKIVIATFSLLKAHS
jgi:hypothetical protein